MTHPVFFSFAGDTKSIAETLKQRFADDLVYIYTRTGVDGESFPDEILEEIAQCDLFVVFWSAAYVEADERRPWCRRELITAARRVASGKLTRYLIIQADSTSFQTPINDPDTGDVVDALKDLRDDRRAFVQPLNIKAIEHRIAVELSQLSDGSLPTLHRPLYLKALRDALDTGTYESKTPIVFISGFHGSGRRTLVRSVMSSDFGHLTEFTMALDSADGPEDLLRLIWGTVLQKSIGEQRQLMKEVERNSAILDRHYKQLGPLLVERRAYVMLTKDELTDVNETVPYWVTQYLKLLSPTVQPLMFLAIPRPLPPHFRRALDHAQEVDLPTLEDEESARLVGMHIAARDPKRVGRWKEHIPYILDAGANSPKLLTDIVRLASRRPSLDFLRQDAALDVARFDERVAKLLDWAWIQVKDLPAHLLLLDILNTLTVAHYETLEEMFSQTGHEVGDTLYELVQFGLVEHLTESTYRIPAALRRKINFYLVNPEIRQQASAVLRRFAKVVPIGNDQFGGVSLTNVLQIRLDTDTPISPDDAVFVTAAMLFKAGWHKYRRTHYASALVLLRRAFLKLPLLKDEATKLEIARFYGLAAAREDADDDLAAVVRYLSNPSNFIPRTFERAKPTALFLQGFSLRLNQQFRDALEKFEQSLAELPEAHYTDQQRSTVMNEMVQCLLKLGKPDYVRAVDLAERVCFIRTTANNLDVLLRALVAQIFEDPEISQEQVDRNYQEVDRRELQLKEKCDGSHLSFYASRVIDRLEKEAMETVKTNDLPFGGLDLSKPIRICHDAFLEYQEEALLSRKWDLMLRTEVDRDWPSLHDEVSRYLEQGSLNRMGRGVAARIRILTFDMTNDTTSRLAYAELKKYRANRTIPNVVAIETKKRLDAGDRSKLRLLDF